MMNRILDIIIFNARILCALNLYVHDDPKNRQRKIFRIRNVGERTIDIIDSSVIVDDIPYIVHYDDGNLSLVPQEMKSLRLYSPPPLTRFPGDGIGLTAVQKNLKNRILVSIVYKPVRSIFKKREKFRIDKDLKIERY